ncbi:MAG: ArsR family transcriptional regulator [Solirubrobacterales bacterium]|nr:ArsR family transcriptional regulator [Solirubrobacterales bacterium]
MAKNDRDLFDRLRQAGVRKKVAKTLSEISEDASNRTVQAARGTAAQLRSLADEIERRLPRQRPAASNASRPARRRSTGSATRTRRSSTRATPRASRSRAAGATRASRSSAAGATRTSSARAPRGQNKAKILASLKKGPKTASEIAKETGIGTGTVGSTLTKMATAGDVVKAERGYGLPK